MYFSFQLALGECSGRAPLLDTSQAAGTNVLRLGYPEMSLSGISGFGFLHGCPLYGSKHKLASFLRTK